MLRGASASNPLCFLFKELLSGPEREEREPTPETGEQTCFSIIFAILGVMVLQISSPPRPLAIMTVDAWTLSCTTRTAFTLSRPTGCILGSTATKRVDSVPGNAGLAAINMNAILTASTRAVISETHELRTSNGSGLPQ